MWMSPHRHQRFSVSRGLTTPTRGSEHQTRHDRQRRRVVLLADHTKFDNDCFAKFGELSDVDLLVTDSGLS